MRLSATFGTQCSAHWDVDHLNALAHAAFFRERDYASNARRGARMPSQRRSSPVPSARRTSEWTSARSFSGRVQGAAIALFGARRPASVQQLDVAAVGYDILVSAAARSTASRAAKLEI